MPSALGKLNCCKQLPLEVKSPLNRLGLLFLIFKEPPTCIRIKLFTQYSDHPRSKQFPFPQSFLSIRANKDTGLHAD